MTPKPTLPSDKYLQNRKSSSSEGLFSPALRSRALEAGGAGREILCNAKLSS